MKFQGKSLSSVHYVDLSDGTTATVLPVVIVIYDEERQPWAGFVTVSPSGLPDIASSEMFSMLMESSKRPEGGTDVAIQFTPLENTHEFPREHGIAVDVRETPALNFFCHTNVAYLDFVQSIEKADAVFCDFTDAVQAAVFGTPPRGALANPAPGWKSVAVGSRDATGGALVKSLLYRIPGGVVAFLAPMVGVGMGGAILGVFGGVLLSALGAVYGLYAGGRDSIQQYLADSGVDKTHDVNEIASRIAWRSSVWGTSTGFLMLGAAKGLLGLMSPASSAVHFAARALGGVAAYGMYYSVTKDYLEEVKLAFSEDSTLAGERFFEPGRFLKETRHTAIRKKKTKAISKSLRKKKTG